MTFRKQLYMFPAIAKHKAEDHLALARSCRCFSLRSSVSSKARCSARCSASALLCASLVRLKR